ncbi:MAG: LysR family transcriptional regulator [Rhodobacteraceae bacterium]|nr:LysR family transcriptional regulator [Paracoccaceae bacterium]
MLLNLPFTALRAYEAVVRLSSFSAAADELGVSQSAVSQHVRTLEDWLGLKLLIRGARKSEPTQDGARLAQAISEGLGRVSDLCDELRNRKRNENTIVISCLPGFAFIWLFPRLVRFDLAHPDLAISIATDAGQTSLAASGADIAIRYGTTEPAPGRSQHLMGERVFPVCSPDLRAGPRPLQQVSDLAHHTLLQDDHAQFGANSPTWEFWARDCGLHLPTPERTRRFGQSNMVVQAAIDGMGVGLGREPLVVDALADGRLIRPFPEVATSHLNYWLEYQDGTESSRKIAEFLSWIHEEARKQPDLPEWS